MTTPELLSAPDRISPDISEKPEAIHFESEKPLDELEVLSSELRKSRWDELSILQTVWTFRRVTLVVLAVYTGMSFRVAHAQGWEGQDQADGEQAMSAKGSN